MAHELPTFVTWMVELFAFTVGAGLLLLLLAVLVMYLVDINQHRHTLRRNYPVIGRFRYWFEYLGEFFRQYFFALDREELPFNRIQRSWVYRAAKNITQTRAFGSREDMNRAGYVYFVNNSFPTLEEDYVEPATVEIGPYCRLPYRTAGFFHISGMSYGALSKPAVRALSRGAKQAGVWLNTGEGGLSDYHLEGDCDLVMQIGTAKFGLRDAKGALCDQRLREIGALPQVKMFEIKLSQGAKPGKGGILPAVKVNAEIARIRGIPEGEAAISPNGHPDIRSSDQLLAMLDRIRAVTGKPVGIKMVMGDGRFLEELLQLIHRGGDLRRAPDFISIDGGDGGTGAAPQSLMDHMGLPVKESLPLAVDLLVRYGLRERIKVNVAGRLINPSDVAWALCVGADFVSSARGYMFALGCIQALQCNRNTCPTGVATHNPKLQRGLDPTDKAQRVAHYADNMMKEVGVIAHACGVAEPRLLRREHARIVQDSGLSVSLQQLYPEVEPVAVQWREVNPAPVSDGGRDATTEGVLGS